jgi:hypothetical protein
MAANAGYEIAGQPQMDEITPRVLSPADAKRQKLRSIAIGLALALLALMFYAATIVQFGALVPKGPA